MRYLKGMLCILAIIFLTSCINQQKPKLEELTTHSSVHFKMDKAAYLYWATGDQFSSNQSTFLSPNTTVVGALLATHAEHGKNRERYIYTYGHAQQEAVINELKRELLNQHAFSSVTELPELKKINPQDVLIKLYFKTTRVLGEAKNFGVELNVEMGIQHQNKTFIRSYLISSTVGNFFPRKTFAEQAADASQQLLEQLIEDLDEWSKLG